MNDWAAAAPSTAFELLHEGVRRWIWRRGWEELRDIQERSIPILLAGDRDLVVAASTASGKTEAAFLPIVSRLAGDGREEGGGFEAVYVGPLRALINDQFARLDGLCDELGVAVTRWHGDVAASVKARARRRPDGVMLTTPESLEAILCRRGVEAVRLFGALRYVVVDEMHAFLGTARGRQLRSLLHRIELASGRRVARVGLSATLADMTDAAAFLRSGDPGRVAIVESSQGGAALRLQLRGYVQPAAPAAGATRGDRGSGGKPSDAPPPDPVAECPSAEAEIARHVFETLRGSRGLVFAGSRRAVETMTADLSGLTEAAGVPEEFLAHHGSLSRELREEAERRLKDDARPATIVCTTTLELGIDVGHVEQVAQLGPGRTVSGMRQRLGRSGRRAGRPAVMRIYVREPELTPRSGPLDELRVELVQAVAMVELMLRRWNEPAAPGRLDLSTLIQQILSLIAQHGGITAAQAWDRLCAGGTFPEVDRATFTRVLRRMGHADVRLIEQVPDDTLLPGAEGERVLAGRDFYAVFTTPEEYRVVTDGGRVLGTVPVDDPLIPQQLIIFGGRRWRVLDVDPARREVLVAAAAGGNPPRFGGEFATPDEGVVAEMRAVWRGDVVPVYLDRRAAALLAEGRDAFRRLGLREGASCRHDDGMILFPWCGSRAQTALSLTLAERGLEVTCAGVALLVRGASPSALRRVLGEVARAPAPDATRLAGLVRDKVREKYDRFLDEDLLRLDWASRHLDAARVPGTAATLLTGLPSDRSDLAGTATRGARADARLDLPQEADRD